MSDNYPFNQTSFPSKSMSRPALSKDIPYKPSTSAFNASIHGGLLPAAGIAMRSGVTSTVSQQGGGSTAIPGATGNIKAQQLLSTGGGTPDTGNAQSYQQNVPEVMFSPSLPNLYGSINTMHAPASALLDPVETFVMHNVSSRNQIAATWSENAVYNRQEVDTGLTRHSSMASLDFGLTNSIHHRRLQSTDTTESVASGTSASGAKIARSVLLELRYLQTLTDEDHRRNGKRFTSRIVGVSRGIAGSSAVSTCLTFRPIPDGAGLIAPNSTASTSSSNASEYKVQVATGLSSGSLCIHTGLLSNLDAYDNNQLPPPEPTTLNVAYYATRHTKQATSAEWRPKDTRYVAVGLQSQRVKGRGEEFCCLVWDIEHQSSGSASVGAGSSASSTGVDRRESVIKGEKECSFCCNDNLRVASDFLSLFC